MRIPALVAAAAALILTDAAWAVQDDQIVVTGTRISRDGYAVAPVQMGRREQAVAVPHIHIVRRADNFLVSLEILSDTRDMEPRREEVRETLRTVLDAAEAHDAITVVVMRDGLIDVDPSMLDQIEIAEHPRREDVSTVTVYLKTAVGEEDGYDDADNRIAAFAEALTASGRAVISPSSSYSLTLTGGADQYRDDVVRAIANDVRFLRSTFGNDYEINVSVNLQQRVQLLQSGPLELSIYLPYQTSIALRDD